MDISEMILDDQPLSPEERLVMDEKVAIKHGIKFSVLTKEGKSMRWNTVYTGITPLSEAFRLASELDAFEVSIFREDGIIYWSSKFKILNSLKFYTPLIYDE